MFDLENYMRKNLEKLSFEAFKKYILLLNTFHNQPK